MAPIDKEVILIGGGFGGCYQLKLLREKGFSTTLIEAAPRLGGVWAWSRYPGARVDCELPYYGFSDPAIWGTWNWKERFPDHHQLRDYFDHVAKVWDLNRDCVFNTQVIESRWNEDEKKWLVKTSTGQEYRAKWLISATGTSFKQHIPDFPGREKYKGEFHHSALWPEDLNIEGKKLAVIGAGSSGVQVLQEAAKSCTQVTQFIRTPCTAVPMRQRQISEEEILCYKHIYPHVFRACRRSGNGQPYEAASKKTFDVSPEERMATMEEQWARGGFNWTRAFSDVTVDKKANREFYNFYRNKQLKRMTNKEKADILLPEELPYWIITKRPSLEQNYYEAADQDNVDITNSPIVELTETGIKTKDGKEREFDIIAVCTGYDAVTGGLRTMNIKGRNGIDLSEKWSERILTNVGMTVNGFPNFLMLYGPQAPTSLTNGPPFLELQCEYLLDILLKQRGENLSTIESSRAAEEAWADHNTQVANMTLAMETDSWWNGSNVPGKKKEFLIYLGGMPRWHDSCKQALDNWSGFDVTRPAKL